MSARTAEPLQNQILVVGPGALGLLVGRDLSGSGPVTFLGRSTAEISCVIQSQVPQLAGPFTATITAPDRLSTIFKTTDALTILFCTPPHVTESAVGSLVQCQAVRTCTQVTWIFCQNGLLKRETLQEILSRPEWRVVRALFYVGSQRLITSSEVHIVHAGGTQVSWGFLAGEEVLPVNGHALEWVRSPSIAREEVEKLFVNLALALISGPLPVHNAKALQQMERLLPFLSAFQACFSQLELTKETLLGRLRATVLATANNVNSISLAWSQGNRAPLESLLHDLARQPGGAAAVSQFWSETRFHAKDPSL